MRRRERRRDIAEARIGDFIRDETISKWVPRCDGFSCCATDWRASAGWGSRFLSQCAL